MVAGETEVLFGGAAGGGKSYGQLLDALSVALRYPGSRQLILRRTYPELDRSLVRVSLSLFPREIYTYSSSSHTGIFKNGSIVDFGYCADENDVFRFQSAEYDVIRFDELTHFTEFQYIYLISRLRGMNPCPKQIKSTTNPGGVGHAWVKTRFIDPMPPETAFVGKDGASRIFIPARVDDNRFLSMADPDYKKRLSLLPDREKKALLYGDWNIFEGQFFSEFDLSLHTVDAFPIPSHWRRYRTIDYGLDRLVCLWIAVSPTGECYVYRELAGSDMVISEASRAILLSEEAKETVYATLAPPDLWHRTQESGKSKASLFRDNGILFTRSSNDREAGWLALKELLRPRADGTPTLRIFRSCRELIRCLPALQVDRRRPGDTMTEPHSLTHAPDALRGFAVTFFSPPAEKKEVKRVAWTGDMWQDFALADKNGREYLKKKYGEPL